MNDAQREVAVKILDAWYGVPGNQYLTAAQYQKDATAMLSTACDLIGAEMAEALEAFVNAMDNAEVALAFTKACAALARFKTLRGDGE